MLEEHGEFLFYDSKEKQEYCCYVRKVLPNQKALADLDVWVTGLRRDQSAGRAQLPRLEHIERPSPQPLSPGRGMREGKILKVNPLADWTEDQVGEYLKKNNIPNHPLIGKEFPGGY